MNDFQINKSSSQINLNCESSKDDEYQALKETYLTFKNKSAKSDFANSAALFEKELELLNKMLEEASAKGLEQETFELKKRIRELNEKLKKEPEEYQRAYYKDLLKTTPKANKPQELRTIEDIPLTDRAQIEKNLNENLKTSSQIQEAAIKMYKAQITPEVIGAILTPLATVDNNGAVFLNENTLKSLLALKKILTNSQKNEKQEHEHPLNKLKTPIYEAGGNILYMKDDKMKVLSNSDLKDLQNKYNSLISLSDDKVLLEFINKHLDENSEIDSKYLRTISALKQSGVTNAMVLTLSDLCFDEQGQIDPDKLYAIKELKKSNLRDTDLLKVLSNIDSNDEGKLSREDLQNAAELSKAVLSGDEISELIPTVRNNPSVKSFVIDMAEYLDDKSFIKGMVPSVTNFDGKFDINAADVYRNLAENLLNSPKENMDEETFTKFASDIIEASKNSDETTVNDDSAGICAIMCSNQETSDNILTGLLLCKDNKGNYDGNLAQILWDLSLQNANINEISNILTACKDENNNINYTLAETIKVFLENGEDKEKVKAFLFK